MFGPGDEGYDEARTTWNAMIDKRPAAIARCTGVADVIDVVNFARTNGALLAGCWILSIGVTPVSRGA